MNLMLFISHKLALGVVFACLHVFILKFSPKIHPFDWKKGSALIELSCIWHENFRSISPTSSFSGSASTLLLALLFPLPVPYQNYNGFRMG